MGQTGGQDLPVLELSHNWVTECRVSVWKWSRGFLSTIDVPCNVIEDHQGDGAFSHICSSRRCVERTLQWSSGILRCEICPFIFADLFAKHNFRVYPTSFCDQHTPESCSPRQSPAIPMRFLKQTLASQEHCLCWILVKRHDIDSLKMVDPGNNQFLVKTNLPTLFWRGSMLIYW